MAGQALNDPADIPPELDRWNWGAFFLNWIWGLGNGVFIALLAFVPFVGFIMLFVLGARGSRWAWRNHAWRDAEHFRRVQRKWAIWGAVIWVLVIGFFGALAVSVPLLMKNSDAYRLTMEAASADGRVREALGDDLSAAFWIGGSVSINNGQGTADYRIRVTGSKASGVIVSHAVSTGGPWVLKLLLLRPDAGGPPVVIVNADDVPVDGVLAI